jgi:hypothetical protein
MEDIGSLIGAIALWIGMSCGLWWLHRRRLHGRQNRQLDQAKRAIELAAEASAIFDAIRASEYPLSPRHADTDDLKSATHALLRRIQERGDFFDGVNDLRVRLQASLGVDDHPALSEILDLRRDLWAASEILLVDDPAVLGTSFAEPGAFERIRDEAVHLLFKQAQQDGEEDLIDLRLSLAQEEARSFAEALAEAIRDLREKDRLPTWSEVVAYPIAFFRAIPGAVRTAYAFVQAFFAYSVDAARAIRESDAVARGTSRLQQARQDWPERLSAGFERASHTARGSGAALRQHYDFLVTAYDFQTKYGDVLRRAPELTERGRQFVARLELAEKSERLRLTSANATIWLARRLLDGSAHGLAAVQRIAAWIGQTTLWGMVAALLAPVPPRGRETPAFRSYAMALAASGLSEAPRQPVPRASWQVQTAGRGAAAMKGKASAKGRAATKAKAAEASKPTSVARAGAAAKPSSTPRQQGKAASAKAGPAPAAKQTAKASPAPAPAKPQPKKRPANEPAPAAPTWRTFFAVYATKDEPPAKQNARSAAPTEKPSATEASAKHSRATFRFFSKRADRAPAPKVLRPPVAKTELPAPPEQLAAQVAPAKPTRQAFRLFSKTSEPAAAPVVSPQLAARQETPAAGLSAKPAPSLRPAIFAAKGEPDASEGTLTSAADDKPAARQKPLPGNAAASHPAETTPEPKPIPVIAAKAVHTAPRREKAKPARKAAPVPVASNADVEQSPSPILDSVLPSDKSETSQPSVFAQPAASIVPEPVPAEPLTAEPILVEVLADTGPEPEPEPPSVILAVSPPAEPLIVLPEEEEIAPPPPKRPSFLTRLFSPAKARAEREAQQEAERLAAALAEAVSAGEIGAPLPEPRGAPTLMAKLSSLEVDEHPAEETRVDDGPDEMQYAEEAVAPPEAEATEPQDEPGPLTLSIMELQAKIGVRPPQIRSFPWLRG